MRRDVPLWDAEVYARKWRRMIGWGPGQRAWQRRRYHKQERQVGKRQTRED